MAVGRCLPFLVAQGARRRAGPPPSPCRIIGAKRQNDPGIHAIPALFVSIAFGTFRGFVCGPAAAVRVLSMTRRSSWTSPAAATACPRMPTASSTPARNTSPSFAAESIVPEVTPYSLVLGLGFALIFSAACAYLGLKIGQVFEAAIPITIMAIGLSSALKLKNALQQNVMIQSIGAASGVVVAGAIFTLPGIYILGLAEKTNFLQMMLASLLGGFLGILFLVPFRRYFVKDMHGEFPFPEATASTEVLMAGEAGGDQAGVLVVSGLVGGRLPAAVADPGLLARDLRDHGLQLGPQGEPGSAPGIPPHDRGRHRRPGLHHRAALRADHLLWLVPQLVRHDPHDRPAGQGRGDRRHHLPAQRCRGP